MALDPMILPEPASSTHNQISCNICQSVIQPQHWDSHLRSVKHKSREAFTRYRSALEVAEADKHDVVVEGVFDLGFVAPVFAAVGVEHVATVSTSAPFSKTVLTEVKLASAHGTRTVVSRCVFTLSILRCFGDD
jgi:helicase MOV-10